MKYYIVSSAQALGESDPHLTELGRKQAARLGDYVKYLGYKGMIYTYPCNSAMETAQIIASIADLQITNWTDEMDSAALPADTLFVGNAQRADKLIQRLNFRKYKPGTPDCSFTVLDTEGKLEPRCKDVAHLPAVMISNGEEMLIEKKRSRVQAYMENGVQLPDEITKSNSFKLLHIGDTHTLAYPFYADLIAKVKPDVIIHTGDFADEVKVGRMINTEDEYTAGLITIAEILKNSGAKKIYVTPGNNDIPDLIRKLMPFAEYVEPNSVVEICGITCTLGHECYNTTAQAQWSFYGHGLTGETWSPDMNADLNGTCRFNATWGNKVFLLPDMKVFNFKEP